MGAITGLIASGASSLINKGIDAGIQYGFQKDQQAFNSAEAAKARDFTAGENTIMRGFNAAEAAKAREWQEHMSSTAMQRQMADMKAAGLNPAALGGSAGAPNVNTTAAQAGGSSSASQAGSGLAHVNSIFSDAVSRSLMENGKELQSDVKKWFNRLSVPHTAWGRRKQDRELAKLLNEIESGQW